MSSNRAVAPTSAMARREMLRWAMTAVASAMLALSAADAPAQVPALPSSAVT
jgi:hypothetical protein